MSALLTAPHRLLQEISVERYHDLIGSGAISEDDRVELLRGALVRKMGKHPPHKVCNRKIDLELSRAVPAGWHVTNQDSLTLADSEPEPDAMVVRGKLEDYGARHPGPAEVGLVVEVAESSLGRDRGVKRTLYAEAGIPWYWIANVVDRRIEVYSAPDNGAYTTHQDYLPGETLPLVLDGVEVARFPVTDLLP